MLYNIKTGRNVAAVPMRDIMIMVSSLPRLAERGVPFVFTDRHAYLAHANFSSDLSEVGSLVDWDILRRSDFQYDPQDPGKMERYQAEALVHKRLDLSHVTGILVYDESCMERVSRTLRQVGSDKPVKVDRRFFF